MMRIFEQKICKYYFLEYRNGNLLLLCFIMTEFLDWKTGVINRWENHNCADEIRQSGDPQALAEGYMASMRAWKILLSDPNFKIVHWENKTP